MTDDEAREHNGEEEVRRDVQRLEALKLEKAALEAEIDDIEKYLDKAIGKSFSYDDEEKGERVTATVVRGTVDHFDDHLMSTRYKRIYTAVTKRTVNKTLYLDAIRSGLITPELNAKFHHEVPKKPYVIVTRHKREIEQ